MPTQKQSAKHPGWSWILLTQLDHRAGTQWRPYVRAGVRFLSKDSFRARAGFQGSPAGIAPFRVTSLLDQTLAEVSPASAFGKATISVCASTMTAISGASPPIMAARSNCVRR